MKKIVYAIAIMCLATVAFSSCKKEEPKIQKRLTMCGDEWDKYYFDYGANGFISKVKRNPSNEAGWGGYERIWTFTWNGNTATVKYVKEGEEQDPLTFVFGNNGYVQTYTDTWGDVRKATYDLEGHLLKVFKVEGGQDLVKCSCIWENGNLKKWSRYPDGIEEFKEQTFLNEENVAGIYPDATDKAGIDRWMIELGFFGKPSKQLLDQAAWVNSEAIATHTYTKDADGFVTKVEKFYDGELDQTYEYVWEKLTK